MMLAYPWLHPHHATPAGEFNGEFPGICHQGGTQTYIVDTCIGANRQREYDFFSNLQSRFLEDLEAIGITPSDVDTVLVHPPAFRSRRLEYPLYRRPAGFRRSRTRATCWGARKYDHWMMLRATGWTTTCVIWESASIRSYRWDLPTLLNPIIA